MTDEQVEPVTVLVICNLLLAGEGPTILKIGDIIPLLKDMRRTRPITCLNPKLVDAVISRRLMLVLQEYGLPPEGTYGFVNGGAPEWPTDLVSGIQWRANRQPHAKPSSKRHQYTTPSTTLESIQHAVCLQCLRMWKHAL